MQQKKITIKEIAERAEVSTATVSRVINNYKWLNPELKERVLAVMQELHYTPNYNAAAMAKGRSNTIVIVVPNIVNPFFTSFVSIAMRALRPAEYIPLIFETDNNEAEELRLLTGSIGNMADGVISVTDSLTGEKLKEVLALYKKQDKPILFVDRSISVSVADSIAHDNVGAVCGVVNYFAAAGHSKIAIIIGDQGESVVLDKLEGYRKGLEQNGLAFRPEYLRQGKWDRETGQRETAELLNLAEPPTAIFAANNYISQGVLDELDCRGLRTGVDISLIGTEECQRDILDSEKLGITNLRLASEELALRASQHILQKLADIAAGKEQGSYSKTICMMKFIERKSVASIEIGRPLASAIKN